MSNDLIWGTHQGPTIGHKDDIDIINCERCGFAHVIPLPCSDDLVEFYRDSFYGSEIPDYLEKAKADKDWLHATYNDRYATFEEHLPKDRRQILDVGCGPGFFLDAGLRLNWNVLGLEPSPHAAEFARGHGADVITDFFEKKTAASIPKQDVVHMSQVLEHVPNPAEIITYAHGVLADDGLICISVPNDFSALQQATYAACNLEEQGKSPWWISPTHHLNYFNFDSLSALLNQQGFTEIHRESTFPLEMFALMGEDYLTNPELGPGIHAKRKAFELSLDKHGFNKTKRNLYVALAQAGLGRLAIITARKR